MNSQSVKEDLVKFEINKLFKICYTVESEEAWKFAEKSQGRVSEGQRENSIVCARPSVGFRRDVRFESGLGKEKTY